MFWYTIKIFHFQDVLTLMGKKPKKGHDFNNEKINCVPSGFMLTVSVFCNGIRRRATGYELGAIIKNRKSR